LPSRAHWSASDSPDMNHAGSESIRLVCVELMCEVQTRGGSFTRLIPEAQARVSVSERAQLQAWCYGLARYAGELSGLVNQLVDKPLKKKDLDVQWLLQLGIFQLKYTHTRSHAAVDETVKTVKLLKKPWAKALVNGVLRNYQRQRDEIETRLSKPEKYSHPQWLLERLQADWGNEWVEICEQNNKQGPMTLRVNTQRLSAAQYQVLLREAGIKASLFEEAPQAVKLSTPQPTNNLPGFGKGDVSVQDAAAQLAAAYMIQYAKKGGRVLDACAAPGGKTAHLLETNHFSEVVAIDVDSKRLGRVSETMERLGLADKVSLEAADASDVDAWWDGEFYDAVLLDAPCSGTGVIRRHPDIKLLRRPTDIPALVETQQKLMDALWATIADDGLMLYATCSVLKSENEKQVEKFLSRTPNARLFDNSRQILPGQGDMDGFFYAPLRKVAG